MWLIAVVLNTPISDKKYNIFTLWISKLSDNYNKLLVITFTTFTVHFVIWNKHDYVYYTSKMKNLYILYI